MPISVDNLALIVCGKNWSSAETCNLTQKEIDILHECEDIGLPHGFLTSVIKDKNMDADNSGSDAMEHIANDLTDICELESETLKLNVEQISLQDVISSSLDCFHEIAKSKDITLIARIDDQPLKVYADTKRIMQVLTILISNAITASREGSTIELLVKGLPQEIIISIIDHGVGIPSSRIKTIFKRFSYCSSNEMQKPGSGIALNLAKLLVNAHAGKIWAESSYSHGSCFSFCIPREMFCHYLKPTKIKSFFG